MQEQLEYLAIKGLRDMIYSSRSGKMKQCFNNDKLIRSEILTAHLQLFINFYRSRCTSSNAVEFVSEISAIQITVPFVFLRLNIVTFLSFYVHLKL